MVKALGELLVYTVFMIPAGYVDCREQRIPDVLLAGAGATLVVLRAATGALRLEQLLGAGVGLLALLAIWLLAPQRLGLGDVKLSALTGFFLGVWGWALALFAASAAGVAFVLLRSVRARLPAREEAPVPAPESPGRAAGSAGPSGNGGPVPFAPFLVGGAALSFFALPLLEASLGL